MGQSLMAGTSVVLADCSLPAAGSCWVVSLVSPGSLAGAWERHRGVGGRSGHAHSPAAAGQEAA